MTIILATIFTKTRPPGPSPILPIVGRVRYDLDYPPFRADTAGYLIVAWRVAPELAKEA